MSSFFHNRGPVFGIDAVATGAGAGAGSGAAAGAGVGAGPTGGSGGGGIGNTTSVADGVAGIAAQDPNKYGDDAAFQKQLSELQASYAHTTAQKTLMNELKTGWTTTNSVPEKVS